VTQHSQEKWSKISHPTTELVAGLKISQELRALVDTAVNITLWYSKKMLIPIVKQLIVSRRLVMLYPEFKFKRFLGSYMWMTVVINHISIK
jgi:hypothetical protein